jgi:hypothetical protein
MALRRHTSRQGGFLQLTQIWGTINPSITILLIIILDLAGFASFSRPSEQASWQILQPVHNSARIKKVFCPMIF